MLRKHNADPQLRGFTLIELSIVLVIVGLIVGGILVGRDLIEAAAVRSQISQIQKYQTAVNTFKLKYGGLPGDITNDIATAFGFIARGPGAGGGNGAGEGDGNGLIEGWNFQANAAQGVNQLAGETLLFWADLSAAGLIEGSINPPQPFGNGWVHFASEAPLYFPPAKIGRGNYVSVWSLHSINYFAVCTVAGGWGDGGFGITGQGAIDQQASLGISVSEAYAIDSKIDDGLPQSGKVMAMEPVNSGGSWSNIGQGGWGAMLPPGVQTAGTTQTCYDDNNNPALPEQYSMAQNGGSGINCTLSFQFQ